MARRIISAQHAELLPEPTGPMIDRTKGDADMFSLSKSEIERAHEIYYRVLELQAAAEQEENLQCPSIG